MDSLPPEILCLVLNGAPTTLPAGARGWSPPGRVKHARPFLDPRWRFAARAVCRLWREIIETPTPLQALAITRDRRRGRLPTTDDHDEHSDRCPKRIAGRLVHASAVAQWLATGTGPWAQGDVGAVLAWCEANGGASRGRALMAMVASDVPWAVDAAAAIARERSRSADGDDRPRDDDLAKDAGGGGVLHAWTDRREQSAHRAQMIKYDMWGVAARTASYRTLAALAARMSVSHRAHRLDRAIDCACRLGRTGIICALLDDGARPGPMTWTYAANAPDPGALVALLDRMGDPPPAYTFNAEHDYVPTKGAWIYDAAAAGRWRTLAVCKERGIEFDREAAFIGAAHARRTRVLAWLWDALGHRKDDDEPSGSPVIDLAAAARSAVAHHNRGRAHDVDSLAWLCEVAGYVPLAAELAVLVQRACTDRQVECVLYMMERWPRDVLSLDATTLKHLFRACLCDGVGSLGRFLSVIDANAQSLGPDAICRLDLWEALASARADARHAWTQLPSVAACMRAAHDVSHGRAPRAVDIAQIDRLSGDAGLVWRCERECVSEADSAAEAARKPASIADDAAPCTDGVVLSALAPLATWCRPRPVAPDRFVPGWPRPLAPHLTSVDRVPHNTQNERIVQWLASVGLLVPPPPPPPLVRPTPGRGR